MCVVHVVQILCQAHMTCPYECGAWNEELVDYVRCVCVWLGAAWVERWVSG